MKKILFKALSIVLAVVMLIGVLPFVYRFDKDLAASETVLEENLTNGFVQGPKDAVVFMTSDTSQYFYYYDGVFGINFADNLVAGMGVHDGSDYSETPFERLIFVFTNQHNWGSDYDANVRLTGFADDAEVIWTSKCTVQYPKNVFNFSYSGGIGDIADAVSLTVDGTAQAKTYDYYTENVGGLKIWQRSQSVANVTERCTRLGCNLTWDYINVSTKGSSSGKYPAIDANGYNFKVGENVSFTYASTSSLTRFVLYNNTFKTGRDSVQNIEILSGEWTGLLAYPAEQNCTDTLAGTINVTIGPNVTIHGGDTNFGYMIQNPSVFANANMAETAVINYNINGTKFTKSNAPDATSFTKFYVLGGHRCQTAELYTAGETTNVLGTININIDGYNEDNPFPLNLVAQRKPASSSRHNYIKVNNDSTGLTVNAYFGEDFAIAEGNTITIHPDDFHSGNAEYITSTAYINEAAAVSATASYIQPVASAKCPHLFTATAGMVEEQYKISLSCNNGCGLVRDFDADRNGHPAVYVDALTGNDAYLGNTVANAVQSMDRASEILAKWNVGGTIVVVDGHNNREYASGFETINSAGGTITITSSTLDFITAQIKADFRETAGACFVPYVDIWTYEDVVLENLDIVSNIDTKVFYLNGNSFAIKDTCSFRDYSDVALAGVGARMELAEGVSTTAVLAIVTGYNPGDSNIDSYSDDIGTQNIVLEKGNFALIVFGNQNASLDATETKKPLSGNVNVYIGKDAIVTNIDAKPEVSTSLNPTFIFENRTDYTITGEDTENTGVNVKAYENVINALNDHVVKVSGEKLVFVQNSVKWENNEASVRVEEMLNAAWMDENVAELGFFIKEFDNAPFATYFAHAELENYVSEGVGKSLVYENTEDGAKNYFWDGESENVTFRGVLTFDTVDGQTILNADKEFIAVPYALLANGEFVNGAAAVFTLREVCEAILADENSSEDDKEKANAILAAIPAEKQLPEISVSEGTITPDPEEPDSEPVTEPTDEPVTEPAQKTPVFDENNIVFSFGALSDIHVTIAGDESENQAKFENAIEKLLAEAAKLDANGLDAICIAGDLTNTGSQGQVNLFKDSIEKYKDTSLGANVFFTTGNHDVCTSGKIDSEKPGNLKFIKETLADEYFAHDIDSDYEKGYRHVQVGDKHFIFVEPEKYGAGSFCPINDEVVTWVDNTLNKITTENPNDYVFLFTHPMIADTVYGSYVSEYSDSSQGARWSTKSLTPVLEKYPQVVTFGGHTHFPLGDERSIWQGDFTALGCGSGKSYVFEYGFENSADYSHDTSSGLLLQIDENGNMRITRMFFTEGTTFKTPWEVSYPTADKSHLAKYNFDNRKAVNEAPTLSGDLEITQTDENKLKINVIIPAASDDDFVHHYVVKVENANTNELIREFKFVTDFATTANPGAINTPMTAVIELPDGVPCKLTAYAVDSWNAVSASLTASYTAESEIVTIPALLDFEDLEVDAELPFGEPADPNLTPEIGEYSGGFIKVCNYNQTANPVVKEEANGDKYLEFRMIANSGYGSIVAYLADTIPSGVSVTYTIVFRETENFTIQSGQTKGLFIRPTKNTNDVNFRQSQATALGDGWYSYTVTKTLKADVEYLRLFTYADIGHGFDLKSISVIVNE